MTAQRQKNLGSFDVTDDWSLPDLTRALRAAADETIPTVQTSTSEFFDTADRDLSAFGATLERRSGGSDAGWELTLPTAAGPTAHLAPLGTDAAVPETLAALVSGISRGGGLVALATVRCERTTRRWLDDTDTVVVEISDQSLHTAIAGSGAAVLEGRRELIVEPGPAAHPKLVRRLGKALTAAGATPLETAVGPAGAWGRLARPPRPEGQEGNKNRAAAADAVIFLAAQDAALLTEDVRLRTGEEDVHAVRVATRRARSTLKIFGELFDPTSVSRLDTELSWYATLLGEVRDRQVQRARFAAALAGLPDELVLGPVAATIEQTLLSEQLRARKTLQEAMSGDRYHELLRISAAFVRHPPLAARPPKKGKDVTAAAVRRAGRKAHTRLDLALATGDDTQLHEARKAAKRARYAAELGNGRGARHRSSVKAFKELQDILGEFQDSAVAAELLRRLGAATHGDAAQNGFTFGILHEQEARRAARARKAAARWRRHH